MCGDDLAEVLGDRVRDRHPSTWPWFGFGVEATARELCYYIEAPLYWYLCDAGICSDVQMIELFLACAHVKLNDPVARCDLTGLVSAHRSLDVSSGWLRRPEDRLPPSLVRIRHDQVVEASAKTAIDLFDMLADSTPHPRREALRFSYSSSVTDAVLGRLAEQVTFTDPNLAPTTRTLRRANIASELQAGSGRSHRLLSSAGFFFSEPYPQYARIVTSNDGGVLTIQLGYALFEAKFHTHEADPGWKLVSLEYLVDESH